MPGKAFRKMPVAKSSGCPGTLDPPQYSLLIVNGLTSRSLGNQGFEPSKKFGRQVRGISGDVWCRSYPDQSRVLPLVGPGPCELGKGQGYLSKNHVKSENKAHGLVLG